VAAAELHRVHEQARDHKMPEFGARARPARTPQENDESETRQPESESQAQKRERRGVLQPQLRRDVAGAPDGYEIPGE